MENSARICFILLDLEKRWGKAIKLEAKIKKIGNKLDLVFPSIAVNSAGLYEGCTLEIYVKNGNMMIINNLNNLNYLESYDNRIEDFFKSPED